MDLLLNELLSPTMALVLVIAAFFSSFITAAMGAGGGLLLLVLMASLLPMMIVIPVHGLVQLGSNANRALATIKHVDLPMLLYFSLGGVLGAALSTTVISQISLEPMKLVLAIFILYLLWGKKPTFIGSSPSSRVVAGAITSFLSFFVGASGPLVGSYMYVNYLNQTALQDKLRFTATFSSCMTMQHSFKAIIFTLLGFGFTQWLPLVCAMVISGALGTFAGLKLLNRITTTNFSKLFKLTLSLLALQLAYVGAGHFIH
ncbi:TSUP family transporter [Shewanella sp. UCD-KL21]|uniref:TSUP family transporter n=1 Tax=Shewanella sp. UCD-KL21 TaxID=1917164 RepID=UPI00097143B5|nr:TSUP family transporter [Shewanella sp. UCD-KL21]